MAQAQPPITSPGWTRPRSRPGSPTGPARSPPSTASRSTRSRRKAGSTPRSSGRRYIAWPTQARAYKLGEIQIRRHRREAEAALGTKFDQRTFHDAILALGAVPLPVLEQRMAQFIADGGTNPPR
jgi:hypothetical protein